MNKDEDEGMREVSIHGKKVAALQPLPEDRLSKEEKFEGGPQIFGRMFWYTVGNCLISIEDLKKLYEKFGLDIKYFPSQVREKDVFKVATKDMQLDEKIEYKGETVYATYMVRTLDSQRREFVRELRLVGVDDKRGDRLDYKIGGEWILIDGQIQHNIKTTDQYLKQKFMEATDKLLKHFETLMNSYTDKQIRDTLRKAVYSLPTISLRKSGGLYFVPEVQEYIRVLNGFSQVLNVLDKDYSDAENSLELMYTKVVTEENERKILIVKYEEDAKDKIDAMLKTMTSILDKEDVQITEERFNDFMAELLKLRGIKEQYEGLLEYDMSLTGTRLDVIQQQLDNLARRIKRPEEEIVDSDAKLEEVVEG